MTTKSPAVRIAPDTMEQLYKAFPGFSPSIIIQSAILYVLLFCYKPNTRRSIPKEKIRANAEKIKSSKKNISYRTCEKILEMLKEFYKGKEDKSLSTTKTIKCCLAEVLYLLEKAKNSGISFPISQKGCNKNEEHLVTLLTELNIKLDKEVEKNTSHIRKLSQDENILYRHGIKSKDTLKFVLNTIEEIEKNYTIELYCELFMGTGNVLCHNSAFPKEILNDKSEELVNLLTVLRDHPIKFIKALASLTVDEKTFDEQENRLQEINEKKGKRKIRGKGELIDKAVAYYYTQLICYYGDRETYSINKNDNTLYNRLPILKQVSERLKNTEITNKDYLNLSKELAETKCALVYVDPPYMGTEDCFEKEAQTDKPFSHEDLCKFIFSLKENCIFVISYRATVTKKNKKTTNKEVQDMLDKLYMNKGFFIQFLEIDNGQIEILLTNVWIKGSVPYDCNIADLIKKHVK